LLPKLSVNNSKLSEKFKIFLCEHSSWTLTRLLLHPLCREFITMDLSPYNWNFDLDKNFITAWKSITKLVIFQSFVAKCCKMRII
jgi:hypothetical protein